MKNFITTITVMLAFLLATATETPAGEPPTKPSNVHSISHTIGISSDNPVIQMVWTPATDPDGDLNGYGTVWDNVSDTNPFAKTLGPSAASATSPELEDGDWYFHIRVFDDEYNKSETIHAGPFVINTQPEISDISPASGSTHSATGIIITGKNFAEGITVKIGDTEIDTITFVSTSTLNAVIPQGLDPGVYDIQVTNTDGKSYTAEDGFTIISENPSIGDINGDGMVNLKDAIIGLQTITGFYPDGILSSMTWDVNGDSRLGMEEVIYVLQSAADVRK